MMKNGNNSETAASEIITILALKSEKFRGDLECLSRVEKFRVLYLESKWEVPIIAAFTNKKIKGYKYLNAEKGDDIYELKRKIDIYFCGFISSLLKLIEIDCVVTPNYRYIEDYPWVMSLTKKGIPHILLFREGLMNTERLFEGITARHALYKRYPLTHLVVHNKISKRSFVESGFASEEQVSICGALRMDNLLKLIINKDGTVRKYDGRRKRVVFFFFPYTTSIFGREKLSPTEALFGDKYRYAESIWPQRINLFRDLHISFARLAQKLPDVDFVIKPKPKHINKGVSGDEYLKIINELGIDLNKLDNYTIEPNVNVHDLIINSDVIIALQSSTVLESAIAGKHVIFPLFYNYKETKNFNDFMWRNHLDLFDVAESAEELEALVVKRIEKPEIDEEFMKGRRELFKEYFSDLDGVALKKYSETIENIVTSAKLEAR